MADQSNGATHPSESEELRPVYDKFRREFTAADLQKYTESEEGIPAAQLLAELEEIHRQETQTDRPQ
jgi:hypothetical protein